MTPPPRRFAALGAVVGLSVAAARRWQERQRSLSFAPIKISKGAGITERRCRRQASLRARSQNVT